MLKRFSTKRLIRRSPWRMPSDERGDMTTTVDSARAYARENGGRFVDELLEMLRIPSVGADPAYAADTRRNAEWLAAHLAGLGLDQCPCDGDGRASGGLRRVARRRAGQAHRAGLRPLRRGAGGAWRTAGTPRLSSRWSRTARSTHAARPTIKDSSSSMSRRWNRISRRVAAHRST